MADNESQFKFGVDVDDKSIKKAVKSLEEVQTQVKGLDKALSETKAAAQAAASLDKVAKANKSLESTTAKGASSLDNETAALKKQERQIRENISAVEAYEQSRKSLQSSGTDFSGDVASSSAGLRGVADFALGADNPLSTLLEGVEALADAGEFLPQFVNQVRNLPSVLGAGSAATTALATAEGTATVATGGFAASVGTVLLALAPIAAVVGGVVLAVKNYSDGMEEQRAQLERNLNAIRDTNLAIADGLTSDDAQAQIEENQRQIEAWQQTLQTANGAYAQLNAGLEQEFGSVGSQLVGAFVRAVDSREEELVGSISEAQAAITDLEAENNRLAASLDNGALAANDAAIQLEETESSLESLGQASANAASQLESSAQRLESIQAQRASTIESYDESVGRLQEDRALAAKRQEQDRAIAAAKHQQNLQKIEADGAERIEEIRSEIADLPNDLADAIGDIAAEGNKKLAALDKDFFKNELKKQADYQRKLEDIEEDAAKRRVEIVKKYTQALFDAAQDNDVISFLQAQRSQANELQGVNSDEQDRSQQLTEEFIRGRQEELDAYNEKKQEILLGIEEEKAAAVEASAERKAQLEQSLSDQIEAIREQKQAAIDSWNEQMAAQQLADQRKAEDEAIADARREEDHMKRLSEIDEQAAAAQAAYAAQLMAVQELQTASDGLVRTAVRLQGEIAKAQAAQSSASSTSSSSSSSSNSNISFFGGLNSIADAASDRFREGGGIPAYGNGGVVTNRQFAIVGDMTAPNDAEAIIPFNRSQGLGAALDTMGLPLDSRGGSTSRGASITFAPVIQMTVGDVASGSMVRNEIDNALEQMSTSFVQVIQNSVSAR